MPTPSQNLKIHIFGHHGAQLAQVSELFSGINDPENPSECDLAIFAINPSDGIDQETIERWEELSEMLVPRLVAVTGLENPQADFDDAVLLANRVFDKTLTPYLVLHDDSGIACALISLADLTIRNYETNPPKISNSDPEHESLVADFRKEFLEEMEIMGPDAFAAGLLFPAIPLWIEKNIGVDIIREYIEKLERV